MATRYGRPPKYNPSILKKTREYIDSCENKVRTFHKTRGEKSDSYDRLVRANIPTVEGLSLHLGVVRSTLYEWEGKHKAFSDTLAVLKSKQLDMLVKGGLSGDFNPLITKLILSANHGMKERVDQTTDDKPLPAAVQVGDLRHLSDEELLKLAGRGKGRAGA